MAKRLSIKLIAGIILVWCLVVVSFVRAEGQGEVKNGIYVGACSSIIA